MSVESVVIDLAFFVAFAVLLKPLAGIFMIILTAHSGKISNEISSVNAELEEARRSLALAMERNSFLGDEVEAVLADAKSQAVRVVESGKLRVEKDFSIATDNARKRALSDNKDFILRVRLALLEGVFSSLARFGGKSLKKAEHEALLLHAAKSIPDGSFSSGEE